MDQRVSWGGHAVERKQVQAQVLKGLNSLSQESLQQVRLFIDFLRLREKIHRAGDDLGYDLALLDEIERTHLEDEFEGYRERYPHEG